MTINQCYFCTDCQVSFSDSVDRHDLAFSATVYLSLCMSISDKIKVATIAINEASDDRI